MTYNRFILFYLYPVFYFNYTVNQNDYFVHIINEYS